MRRAWFFGVAGLAIMASAAGCSSRAGEKAQHTSLPGLTPERLEALRASAIRGAARLGEAHPTDGLVVATTQHAVFRAEPVGQKVDGPDFKVYVVAFSGHLTAYRGTRPPGTPPPTGRFAYAIHRADTLAVTDSGLLEEPFDLERLGPHVALDLHDAERQVAITDAEMFLSAGNARPNGYRISRATRVKPSLWRVEVTARPAPGAGGQAHHSCFTIRLDRFHVHASGTDNVSSRGIETRNHECP